MMEVFVKWDERPVACSMDICVTKDGKTLLVELNDSYALGCYGLGRAQGMKLKVFVGAEHTHAAQQPEVLDISGLI